MNLEPTAEELVESALYTAHMARRFDITQRQVEDIVNVAAIAVVDAHQADAPPSTKLFPSSTTQPWALVEDD